jgi:hypothetical protein
LTYLGLDVQANPIKDKKFMGKTMISNGQEDTTLPWNDYGYYRMNVGCGDLLAFKGVSGRPRNIITSQSQTAPLPHTSIRNGDWTNKAVL